MERGRTGDFFITSVAGEEVRAFVPFDLPPLPPLELGSRLRLLERATSALGMLNSISSLLDPHLFLYSYVRREAVLSSQIEGTQSSLSDLLLFELDEAPGTPVEDVVEVANYVAALKHGVTRLREGFPLSNRLICEMHAVLMAKGRGSQRLPGEFRRSQNWIGGTRPGNARFVPPPPHLVGECMGKLEQFVHEEESGLSLLLRAALVHVQFETIHPFLDGNGRLGRLLIALMLHNGGLLTEPLLYLSLYFKEHRSLYYDLLDRVRFSGDWEAWIDFFLEGVEVTASRAVETVRRLNDLFARDEQQLQTLGRRAAGALRLHAAFRRRPLLTLQSVCKEYGMTFPTASNAMKALVEAGIAEERTGNRRNRVFVYRDYLNLLNEGGDPL